MTNIPFEQIPESLMACMLQTEKYVNSLNIIDEKQMELMRSHASMINGCAYCVDMHFKEAMAAGEQEQRLYSLPVWKKTNFYTDAEQALLAWTESLTDIKKDADGLQDAFEMMQQHFSVDDIANLTLAVVQINSWTRLAKAFGFEPGSYQVGQFNH